MKKAPGLKGNSHYDKVFITMDLTKKQQEIEKVLWRRVKEFRMESGKEQAKIEKGKIVCNMGDQKVVLYSTTD